MAKASASDARSTPTPPQAQTTTEAIEKEVEDFATDVQEGKVDTLDSNARYLGYLARAQRYIIQGSRYVAYTSDIGEAFRPVVPPSVVTAGYAVSWAYLIGDGTFLTCQLSRTNFLCGLGMHESEKCRTDG